MAVETSPVSAIPARNRAGWRERSDLNISALSGDSLLRGRDLVTDAPDRDDRRGVAELPSQLPDVHVHRARVAREGVAPDALEQLVPRQDETAVVEQLPEQVELLG